MAKSDSLKLTLTGLHCVACALSIDDALEEIPGVISSQTSFAESSSTVKIEPNTVVPDDLVATIEELGYKAEVKT